MSGQVFVVSGCSGAGKTSLLKELLRQDPGVKFSVSLTTRPPRPGETPGQDYVFVGVEEFLQRRDEGQLVEWVEQFGHYYGTSRQWVDDALAQGWDLVFDVEIHGAQRLKHHFPGGVFIFVLPPSLAELDRRLRRRGDVPEAELIQRLERVRTELKQVHWYDFLVVNQDLDQACSLLQAIVAAARCRTPIVWPQIREDFEV